MHIVVEQYNPIWASQFSEIKRELETILSSGNAGFISIEHVGSTSVPGLAAKPNIDIDIVVFEDQVQPAISALVNSGLYQNLGELGIPLRYAMRYIPTTDGTTVPRRSTYVTVEGCQSLRNHLAVRELCRTDSNIRDEYGRFKLELSRRDWENVAAYCVAKNDILARILTAAGMGEEVPAIRDINAEAKTKISDVVREIANSGTSNA